MAYLSPIQIIGYLLNAGATMEEAIVLTAVSKLESQWSTTAVNSSDPLGGAHGLFQHLKSYFPSRVASARQMGMPVGSGDIYDPQAQASASYWLFKYGGGLKHWSVWKSRTSNGFDGVLSSVMAAVDQYGAVSSERSSGGAASWSYDRGTVLSVASVSGSTAGTSYTGGTSSGSTGATSPSTAPTGSQVNIPTDAAYYKVGDKYYFTVRAGSAAAGATIFFAMDSPPGSGVNVTSMSEASWKETSVASQWVDGGSSLAFGGAKAGATFNEMLEETLFDSGLFGSDALEDSGVWAVIAEAFGRGIDMSPAEFENRLQQTDWWKNHTDAQRSWNDKSPAQQESEIMAAANTLVGLWFTYVGSEVNVLDWDTNKDGVMTVAELAAQNPALHAAALSLANGDKTQTQIINEYLKPEAKKNPDSPYSRIVRDEEKAQGQHEVDLETAAGKVVELYEQWGLPMDWTKALELGEKIVMNQTSLEELEEGVKDQALALYPTKPREVSTAAWAQPYLQTYSTLMETPSVSLFDNTIQTALSGGLSLADFRKQVKTNPAWMETNNARDEYHEKVAQIGRVMGF